MQKMAVYAPFGINEGPAAGNALYEAEGTATDMQLFLLALTIL